MAISLPPNAYAAPPYSCTRVRTLDVFGVASTPSRSELTGLVGSYRKRTFRPPSWERDSSYKSVEGCSLLEEERIWRLEIPTEPDVIALEVMGLVRVPYGASVVSSVVVVWDMMSLFLILSDNVDEFVKLWMRCVCPHV